MAGWLWAGLLPLLGSASPHVRHNRTILLDILERPPDPPALPSIWPPHLGVVPEDITKVQGSLERANNGRAVESERWFLEVTPSSLLGTSSFLSLSAMVVGGSSQVRLSGHHLPPSSASFSPHCFMARGCAGQLRLVRPKLAVLLCS